MDNSRPRKVLPIIIFSFLFLIISSFFNRQSLCCEYTGARHYGWPFSFFTISQTTSSLEDAKQVFTQPVSYLFQNGWDTDFTFINLIFNYLLCLVVAFILVTLSQKIFSKKVDTASP
jgi:hypothetical protein